MTVPTEIGESDAVYYGKLTPTTDEEGRLTVKFIVDGATYLEQKGVFGGADNSKFNFRLRYGGQDVITASLYDSVFTLRLDNSVLFDPDLPDSNVIRTFDSLLYDTSMGELIYDDIKTCFGEEAAVEFGNAYFNDFETARKYFDGGLHYGDAGYDPTEYMNAIWINSDFNGMVLDFNNASSGRVSLVERINDLIESLLYKKDNSDEQGSGNSGNNGKSAFTLLIEEFTEELYSVASSGIGFDCKDLIEFVNNCTYPTFNHDYYPYNGLHGTLDSIIAMVIENNPDGDVVSVVTELCAELFVINGHVYDPEADGNAAEYLITMLQQSTFEMTLDFADGVRVSGSASIPAGKVVGFDMTLHSFKVTPQSVVDLSKQGSYSFTA